MKTIIARLATTHVDSHYDRLTLSALESMIDQIKETFIPLTVEHNYGLPPCGRILDGEIVHLEDGEYAVDGKGEIFEASDTPESLFREVGGFKYMLPQEDMEHGKLIFTFDPNAIESEVVQDFQTTIQTQGKNVASYDYAAHKALDPATAILIAAGIYAFSNITSGFFQKMGADLWDSLSNAVKRVSNSRQPKSTGLYLLFLLKRDGVSDVEVVVEISNSNMWSIQASFETIQNNMSNIEHLLHANPEFVRLICSLDTNSGLLTPLYAVRKDYVGFRFVSSGSHHFIGKWEFYVPPEAENISENHGMSYGGRIRRNHG